MSMRKDYEMGMLSVIENLPLFCEKNHNSGEKYLEIEYGFYIINLFIKI